MEDIRKVVRKKFSIFSKLHHRELYSMCIFVSNSTVLYRMCISIALYCTVRECLLHFSALYVYVYCTVLHCTCMSTALYVPFYCTVRFVPAQVGDSRSASYPDDLQY